jgi:hypothetical protein
MANDKPAAEVAVTAVEKKKRGPKRFAVASIGPFDHRVVDTQNAPDGERYRVLATCRTLATARKACREEEAHVLEYGLKA